jgi:hypothetical protein
MAKAGSEYENFVANLQKAIFDSEEFTKQKNIVIEQNKKIIDKNGIEREFDLYWEYELGGFTYKTIIECKDYNSTISIEKIDALVGKLHDFLDLRGVFATKMGYQSGALKKAQENNIDLLIIREQNDSDWTDEEGNPLIKIVHIDVIGYSSALIRKFQPYFDVNWIKENTDIDITKPFSICGLNNEIFVENFEKNEKYSLYDLSYKLSDLENNKPGDYEKLFEFSDAYLISRNIKVKISAYKVSYSIQEPIKNEIEIDYSKELLGVIEYLEKGIKKRIFKNGNVN